jgi:hypothetical protein
MNTQQEEIQAIILQFPVEEINELIAEIRKALEIREFMKLAETGFTECNDPEEDIYNVQMIHKLNEVNRYAEYLCFYL